MASYTGYRLLSLLPLVLTILGIIFVTSYPYFNWDHVEMILYAQTASVVVGIAAYILGVRSGMPRSGLIVLALLLPMICLILVWGFIMAVSQGDGQLFGAL